MTKDVREVLYDSEAALRLVDSALLDMTGIADEPDVVRPTPPRPIAIHEIVTRGHDAAVQMLVALRQSRSMLERSEVDRVSRTHDKLREVSTATEVAATDILDGLERANALVDELDTVDGNADTAAAGIRSRLRDELFALVGHMQFQDITSQQLAFASAVLSEVETRLTALVELFDPSGGTQGVETHQQYGAAFDAAASTRDRETRQAVADAIVARSSSRS
jgi:hypothetical protein